MDRGPFLAPVPGGKPERTRQVQPVRQVFVTVLQENAHDVAKSLRVVERAPDSFERMHHHSPPLSARSGERNKVRGASDCILTTQSARPFRPPLSPGPDRHPE